MSSPYPGTAEHPWSPSAKLARIAYLHRYLLTRWQCVWDDPLLAQLRAAYGSGDPAVIDAALAAYARSQHPAAPDHPASPLPARSGKLRA